MMPSRYKYTKIKLSRDGNRVFKPTLYPKIPIRDSDRIPTETETILNDLRDLAY